MYIFYGGRERPPVGSYTLFVLQYYTAAPITLRICCELIWSTEVVVCLPLPSVLRFEPTTLTIYPPVNFVPGLRAMGISINPECYAFSIGHNPFPF